MLSVGMRCCDIKQHSTKNKAFFCCKITNTRTHSGGKSGKPTSKPSGARKKTSSFAVASPVKKATSLEEKVEKPDHGASSQKVTGGRRGRGLMGVCVA